MENDVNEFMMYIYITIAVSLSMIIYSIMKERRRKQKKRKEMEMKLKEYLKSAHPWSKESLKQKYFLEIYNPNNPLGIISGVAKFICPHCLKSVLVEKINLTCPYCDEQFGHRKNDSGSITLTRIFDGSRLINSIFDKCDHCGGIIRFIQCYHCEKTIDLFSPYNESELEAKRYS